MAVTAAGFGFSMVKPWPSSVTTAIMSGTCPSTAVSTGWTGLDTPALMNAFARSVNYWFVHGVWIGGLVTGTLGVGQAWGKLIVPPLPAGYVGGLTALGFTGCQAASLASMCSTGVAMGASLLGMYKGDSPTVGVGAGMGKVYMVNPAVLTAKLVGEFHMMGISGVASNQLAMALALGASAQTMLGFGVEWVTGPPSPIPSPGITSTTIW